MSVDGTRSGERSRERSTSPWVSRTPRVLQVGEIQDLHQMMEAGPDLHPLLEEVTQNPFGKDR